MQPNQEEEQALDKQLDDIREGMREAFQREVETLRREGLPIYVAENGRILNPVKSSHPAPAGITPYSSVSAESWQHLSSIDPTPVPEAATQVCGGRFR